MRFAAGMTGRGTPFPFRGVMKVDRNGAGVGGAGFRRSRIRQSCWDRVVRQAWRNAARHVHETIRLFDRTVERLAVGVKSFQHVDNHAHFGCGLSALGYIIPYGCDFLHGRAIKVSTSLVAVAK